MNVFNPSLSYARELDQKDELAGYRDAFTISDNDLIYMDGNSLGRLPKATVGRLEDIVKNEWGDRLINGWGEGWYDAPSCLGDKIGQVLGAAKGQVVIGDSTSVNLYKCVTAALRLNPGRVRIITDTLNFPTDIYTIKGATDILDKGHQLYFVNSDDDITPDINELEKLLDADTALLAFSTPTFKSGYLYDIPAITRMAHEAGASVLWDFCHSAGVVPLKVDKWGVDFAVGCTYKYMNGGPGSPAFVYVRKELQDEVSSPIQGWWGHAAPFDFDLNYEPSKGIQRFLAGTPPILSTMAVEPAVDMILEIGVDKIRNKSISLTDYMIQLFDAVLAPLGFALGTPRDAERRGSHVSIRHPEGYRISQAMIKDMNVIPDFREPDNVRLGLAPLYTSYADVWTAVKRIKLIMQDELYTKYSEERSTVR